MQYHNLRRTWCWRALNAWQGRGWHIKHLDLVWNGTSKWPLLCLEAWKYIRLRYLKLCIFFFLNILVCCQQQGIKRWRQNGQGRVFSSSAGQGRVFSSSAPLTDSMDVTSLKSLMHNYKSNFGVTHVFSASSDTQAHFHTPAKLCITLGHFIFVTILSMCFTI